MTEAYLYQLQMKITFHDFQKFDIVLQYDGLPSKNLKHSTRKGMIYYWKLGKIKDTVNFHSTEPDLFSSIFLSLSENQNKYSQSYV